MAFVIDYNLCFEDHVRISEIERTFFPGEYRDSPEFTWAIYLKNPETYLCVRDTGSGKIAAHLTLIPVSDETFSDILSGELIDSTIGADRILPYDTPGAYKLHFSAVAIAGEYDSMNLLTLLVRALKNKEEDLRRRGISFTGICADCVSHKAQRLCRDLLNMRLWKTTSRNSSIYWAPGLSFGKRM